jgi:rare lipoprotein A
LPAVFMKLSCMIKFLFPGTRIFLLAIIITGWNCKFSFSQKLYEATGRASFYAKKFEGRKTASGEKFSNKDLTAAHRTLPFGTVVRVTNLSNNRQVIVRINDRGPYAKGRIIDLTHAAADSLDFIHSGWTAVKVEEIVIDMEKLPPPPPLDAEPPFAFPDLWVGDWKGTLKIYDQHGFRNIIPMELQIHPTESPDRYSWRIVYDTSARNYELVIRDSAKKLFSIDEKIGIDVMSYLLGNHFISRFEVEGQLLECEYTLRDLNEMTFSVHAGDDDRHWSTGGVQMVADTIPSVHVYPISVLQFATLQRDQ